MALGEAKNLCSRPRAVSFKPFLCCLCTGFLFLPSILTSFAMVGHRSGHLRIPPGSGVLPFPDVGVWRRVLYGRHSLATFCTKRDIFAINMCPCWLSAYGKVQKRLDIFRDSRITQNIIPNMNALQEGCPAPCFRIGLVWPGVHRQLVIQGKTSNISTSLLKFIQISNYLELAKGWKSWDGGKRQRGRTGERHALDDQILQATYVIQEAYHLPPRLSSKSLLPFPVGQHWIDCLCGQASAERLETPQAKHAWVRTSDYTAGYVEAVDMPGSHLPISFRAQTHRLLPRSKKALREGRGYLLLNSTGAGQGIRRLRVWLFLRWDVAHSPDSQTEVGVTAGPPPLAHHRFTVGSKSAGKSQYTLDFKTLPRRGEKKNKSFWPRLRPCFTRLTGTVSAFREAKIHCFNCSYWAKPSAGVTLCFQWSCANLQ